MFKSVVRRLPTALLSAATCLFAIGCLSGEPFGRKRTEDEPGVQTRPKPTTPDTDASARRVELRPSTASAPAGKAQVFIATVYDSASKPIGRRRVEWSLEGPGMILEVGEGGSANHGTRVDSKFAFSQTNSQERDLTRGGTDFTIGIGQTWCVVSSPVEGQTVVTAYVPAITDLDKNRAYAHLAWTGGAPQFPGPVTAKAGGECTLGTKVAGVSSSYRIRYRIVDGPPAALFVNRGKPVDDVTEAVAPVGTDGTARISVSQPAAAAGTNRIAIELIKPKPDSPGEYTVVSTGETKITWKTASSPQSTSLITISAPRTLALNQDAMVTYNLGDKTLGGNGTATLVGTLPRGWNLVRTEPQAAVDGDQIIWTIRTGDRSVSAVFHPANVGPATLTADLKVPDGTSSHGSAEVSVAESKLQVKLEGPASAVLGETVNYTIRVINAGDGELEKVRVQGRLDDGLEITGKTAVLDETLATIDQGQTRTITVPVACRKAGRFSIEVGAASGSLAAIPQTATIEVKDAQLGISAHGPAKDYVGQEITWQLVVRNTGDVPLSRVSVKASLPPEVTFVKATDGGKFNAQQLTWELGTAPAHQERTIAVTATCDKVTAKSLLRATVTATSPTGGGSSRGGKSIAADKPAEAPLEIAGIPALQISVKDSNDPILVGQRTTYLITVKNAGTQAASKIEVGARVPTQMKPIRATGPGKDGSIREQPDTKDAQVQFPTLATLAPNATATFVVEVEGQFSGDARFQAEAKCTQISQPVRAEEPTRVMVKESGPVGR